MSFPASIDAWRTAGPPEHAECEDCDAVIHMDDAHSAFRDFVCEGCGEARIEDERAEREDFEAELRDTFNASRGV